MMTIIIVVAAAAATTTIDLSFWSIYILREA